MLKSACEYSSTFSESLATNIELKCNVEFVKLNNSLLAGKLIFQLLVYVLGDNYEIISPSLVDLNNR